MIASLVSAMLLLVAAQVHAQTDSLPSWNEGPAKQAVVEFVRATTEQGSPKDWLASAKHPRFERPYTELVYQPMLEVMKLFRANGYKAYFVTGGGRDFVRVYSEQVYGIPPEQVVGSAGRTRFGYDKSGRPMLTKEPKLPQRRQDPRV